MEITFMFGCPKTQKKKEKIRLSVCLYVSSVNKKTFEGVIGLKQNLVGFLYV